jgi:ABC-type transport system substrate-binding protein
VVIAGAGVGQSALEGSSQSGVLISGTTDSITNIDPAGNYDFGTFSLGANIFEHLYEAKNNAKVVPVLATGCVPRGSTKTWRCNLRRGVKFHDGSDFDSADVKFSFDRVNNPKIVRQAAANTPSSLLSNLKSVTRNGRYAVTFNLKAPQSTWTLMLATGAAGIVPSDAYKGNALQPNNQPQIGTGPYRLTRYTPGQQAVFEAFDDYWGPGARNDGLILRYYTKSSTMKLALERGEIDMAMQNWEFLRRNNADWLRDKKINLIVQYGTQRHPELPDVPTIMELSKTDEQRQVWSLFLMSGSIGYSLAMTPDVPADRVAVMRKAFLEMAKDAELKAEAAKMNLPIEPLSGEALEKQIQSVFKLEPAAIDKAKALLKR